MSSPLDPPVNAPALDSVPFPALDPQGTADMGRHKKRRPISVWLPIDDGTESFGLLGESDDENEEGECRKCSRPTRMIIDVTTTSRRPWQQYVCAHCIGEAAHDLTEHQTETLAKHRADAIAYRVAPLLRAEWRLRKLARARSVPASDPLSDPIVYPFAIETRGLGADEWIHLGLAQSLADAVTQLAPTVAQLAEKGIALVQVPE